MKSQNPMKHRRTTLGLGLLLAAGLAGCAGPVDRVILLPEDGGRPSAVEVRRGEEALRLDQPYQAATVDRSGQLVPAQSSAEEVRERYPKLIALRPQPPLKYTLSFLTGTSDLTPESERLLPEVLRAAAARAGGEILVIGHTDTVGDAAANDRLSLQRAQAIRERLLREGFDPERIVAIGRGEREPAVATGDEVNEPRNRRAELIVR